MTLSQSVRKWLPMALCCVPGAVAAVLVLGVGIGGAAFGLSLNSPLGIGLLAVAMLACPFSMILMMRGSMRQSASSRATTMLDSCCAPQADTIVSDARSSAESLDALRARRMALDREIGALQRQ